MKKIIGFLCLIGFGYPVYAETNLSLREALEISRRDNPEIIAAREKWKAARSRIAQKSTPDKPRLDFERMYAPRGKDIISDAEEKNVVISQEIPFPTTLYYQGKQAKEEALAAEAGYRAAEINVAARVKVAYAMFGQSHHHRHIMEENIVLMRQFSRTVEAKYAVGRASQAEALKANVELARMENSLVDMAQEEETSRALLNLLLNRPTESPLMIQEIGSPKPLNKDFAALTKEALANRPELRQADYDVRAKKAGTAAARSDYMPDIMLQYRQRNMVNGMDSQDGMIGLSLPIWFWKQSAMLREAKADLAMAQADQQFMTNMTSYEIKEALTKLNSALRMVQLYEKGLIPQAQQARRAAESAYQGGRGSFLDLLDATRTVLTFQQDYYHSTTDSWKALAELEKLVGSDLQEAVR